MSNDSIKNNTTILPHFSLQKHLIEIIPFYVLITLYRTISKYILFYLYSLSSSIFIELGFNYTVTRVSIIENICFCLLYMYLQFFSPSFVLKGISVGLRIHGLNKPNIIRPFQTIKLPSSFSCFYMGLSILSLMESPPFRDKSLLAT